MDWSLDHLLIEEKAITHGALQNSKKNNKKNNNGHKNKNQQKQKVKIKNSGMVTSVESDIVVLSRLHSFRARTLPLASLASWHLAIEDANKK